MTSRWYLPAGSTAAEGFSTVVDPDAAGWAYSGLRVLELAAGGSRRLSTGEDEVVVLPLAGAAEVVVQEPQQEAQRFSLQGRADVFSGPSDFVYLPRDTTAVVSSASGGRFALPAARAADRLAPRYVPASDVAVEVRGAGSCTRQVNNFCTPDRFAADRLIACEVLTPAGNWSSYPPHKHDAEAPGESVLEEVYYFEVAREGVGYHRVYASDEREIDVLAEVRSGDVVLVPYGWHGPSMAAPGYDLYYLNVMAGPGAERAWRISDDPRHAWVRGTWADQPTDERVPFGAGPPASEETR